MPAEAAGVHSPHPTSGEDPRRRQRNFVGVANSSCISADAVGGPQSRVCACATLRSAPHRHN